MYETAVVTSNFYGKGQFQSDAYHISIHLAGFVCVASFLNVVSHLAVALGALNDTYVLSILVGVGFDVITRLLQLVLCTTYLSSIIFMRKNLDQEQDDTTQIKYIDINTILFVLIVLVMYMYHMDIHVRALFIQSHSYNELQKVLTSALNNLRGIPGDQYKDHFFAYTDLGSHLIAFLISLSILQSQHSVQYAVKVLIIIGALSYIALSSIPFNEVKDDSDIKSLIDIDPLGKVSCRCIPCQKRNKRRKNRCGTVAFTANAIDGICSLWLVSFGVLQSVLSERKKDNQR
jgi:cytochrome bd-type quinol oxidase subunit 2